MRTRPVLAGIAGATALWLGTASLSASAATAGTALCTGPQPDGSVYPGQTATCLVDLSPYPTTPSTVSVVVTGPAGATVPFCDESYARVSFVGSGPNTCTYLTPPPPPWGTLGPIAVTVPLTASAGSRLQLGAAMCGGAGCGPGSSAPLTVAGAAAAVATAGSVAPSQGVLRQAAYICSGTGPRASSVAGSTVTCDVIAGQPLQATSTLRIVPGSTGLGSNSTAGAALLSCDSGVPGATASLQPGTPPSCAVRFGAQGVTVGTRLATIVVSIPAGTPRGAAISFSGFDCGLSGCGGYLDAPMPIGGPAALVGIVQPAPPGPAASPAATATSSSTAPALSSIASSLATPLQAYGSLGHTLVSVGIAAAIVLFITFPAHLFNKTLEENYEEIRAGWERRLGWTRRLRERVNGSGERGKLIAFIVVLLVGAVFGGLLDPHFGFNRSSAITYGAVVLAILVGMTVPAAANFAYRRVRRRGHHVEPHALPVGLAIAVVCVVVSRLTDFQPGYLYGVVCGLAFTDVLASNEQGQAVALGSLAAVSVAVVAWLVWLPLHGAATGQGANAIVVLITDFLGAVFAGGLVGTVLSLFPLRFLPGGALFAWNRVVWAGAFGIALFGLIEVMLRPETARTTKAPLVTIIVLFAVATAASLLFALYWARRKREAAPAAAAPH